jgi:hypothetical protein
LPVNGRSALVGSGTRDNKRIVPEHQRVRAKLQAAYVLRHALHFSLKLLTYSVVAAIGHRFQDFRADNLRFPSAGLRHHGIERWLGIRTLPATAGPDAVTPVNILNRSLVGHALCKR